AAAVLQGGVARPGSPQGVQARRGALPRHPRERRAGRGPAPVLGGAGRQPARREDLTTPFAGSGARVSPMVDTPATVPPRGPRAEPPEEGPGGGRRSLCLYTRSAHPSGMGAHMLDLVQGLAGSMDVTVPCRSGAGARRPFQEASARGARTVALPGPHDPAYPDVISGFLSSRPVDLFHCHAGWGWEDPHGLRLARAAGVPGVIITHHMS